MESNQSNKRTYEFVKKNKPNYLNPDTFSDTKFSKFNSDEFEEGAEEYRDEEIKEIKEIKPVPEEIEEIEEIKCLVSLEGKDSKNKDIVYQGDKFFLTYGNRLGHISKEWVIEELRCKINDLDNQYEEIMTNRKAWFMICEESYPTGGGTHFHVFIFLSKRKKKTLFQLQEHFKLTNEKVKVKPFIKKVEGKNWYFVIKYMFKEDKTPFCSLGSGALLTWMNIISLEKGDIELKKAIYSVIDVSSFLSKEGIKSKEDLRFRKTISGVLGDSVGFLDENLKFLKHTDIMKSDIQINLNGGDVNNYYGLEKKELSNLKKEIREELRQELIVELTTKITNEVTAKITKEVKMNLLAEVKADIWKDFSSSLVLDKEDKEEVRSKK
jgi:hypothetical protein